jgi:histidinol-phosphate aminotransferase
LHLIAPHDLPVPKVEIGVPLSLLAHEIADIKGSFVVTTIPKSKYSRRSFVQGMAASLGALAIPSLTEVSLAAQWRGKDKASGPPVQGGVYIDANENPLGPSPAAVATAKDVVASGGRYLRYLSVELVKTFAAQEELPSDYVIAFPGSAEPLNYAVLSYTSPQRSLVLANPGYEPPSLAAQLTGARIIQVPLTANYEHDTKAMIAQAPDAGVIYICNPNNPTGTITSPESIEYVLANKPKDALVLIDEAYIHYTNTPSSIRLVAQDKDVIVLRTFSKIYGMAGLRCGFAVGRPDLLAKLHNPKTLLPITSAVAAKVSLEDKSLVPQRKQIITGIREETFSWLRENGYNFIPSATNFFLVDTTHPGQSIMDLMSDHKVYIGRVWPVLPTWVRITIGTREEMQRFRTAFKQVLDSGAALGAANLGRQRYGGDFVR